MRAGVRASASTFEGAFFSFACHTSFSFWYLFLVPTWIVASPQDEHPHVRCTIISGVVRSWSPPWSMPPAHKWKSWPWFCFIGNCLMPRRHAQSCVRAGAKARSHGILFNVSPYAIKLRLSRLTYRQYHSTSTSGDWLSHSQKPDIGYAPERRSATEQLRRRRCTYEVFYMSKPFELFPGKHLHFFSCRRWRNLCSSRLLVR
jgi:hypothetical protein